MPSPFSFRLYLGAACTRIQEACGSLNTVATKVHDAAQVCGNIRQSAGAGCVAMISAPPKRVTSLSVLQLALYGSS